ncbi:MAG TPA: SCP2 sterol-binding domain-containing protein [Spirochaetota bacterium]|nr:SCP2 sterol-binding domain-containing protein [Spirochaetota bacterium]HPI90326.1 SCP2 sterol-binding domain-containing protein [Spirochaetota bacterium]HPR49415.1 SCP2 sterol-binding domain-containing protein [Spirochaetota bacterium]
MASIDNIPTDTSVEDLLGKVMPEFAKEALVTNNAAAELGGTEISMVVDVSGKNYSYIVKDGKDVASSNDALSNPMLKLQISEDHLQKMIQTKNLDMILGIQNDINRVKYNALSSLKGSFTAEVANDDGTTFIIKAILNGAEQPHSIFKMSAADTQALMRKETNPVNLFMSGAMKIDGDMSFAMATQPLFT